MNIHYPAYYSRFTCIGGACEDTCCAGWQIGIDDESYRSYRNVQGDFGRRLRKGINHQERVFRLHGRRCAFWGRDGLCDIYRELGRDGLCRTCRTYPRHVEDYGDLQEVMLSLSCPEAARLILGGGTDGRFLEKEHPGKAEPLKNRAFLDLLQDIRQTMAEILEKQDMTWEERLAMILAFAHDIQRRLPELKPGMLGETALPDEARQLRQAVEALSRRYLASDAPARFSRRLAPYRNRGREALLRIAAWVRESAELEPVVGDWRRSQERLCHQLYHRVDMEKTARQRKDFAVRALRFGQQWENLVLYFINTFLLGAVYDGDVLGKVKLSLFSYAVIRENCLAASRGTGELTAKMIVSAAYRYSREVENSDRNLETLEQDFCRNRLFGMDGMMTVILEGPG